MIDWSHAIDPLPAVTDDLTSRRIAYVHATLALETGFAVEFVLPEVWDRPSFITGAGEHYHLGFTPPYARPAGTPVLLILVCAEVLVGRTEHLSEPEFFAFIDSLVLHMQLHVVEFGGAAPADVVEAAVLAEQRLVVDRDFALYERVARPESWRSQ